MLQVLLIDVAGGGIGVDRIRHAAAEYRSHIVRVRDDGVVGLSMLELISDLHVMADGEEVHVGQEPAPPVMRVAMGGCEAHLRGHDLIDVSYLYDLSIHGIV